MLKSEPRGAPKKPPLGRPLIHDISVKSSSPVQTARSKALYTQCKGLFLFRATKLALEANKRKKPLPNAVGKGLCYCRATPLGPQWSEAIIVIPSHKKNENINLSPTQLGKGFALAGPPHWFEVRGLRFEVRSLLAAHPSGTGG